MTEESAVFRIFCWLGTSVTAERAAGLLASQFCEKKVFFYFMFMRSILAQFDSNRYHKKVDSIINARQTKLVERVLPSKNRKPG